MRRLREDELDRMADDLLSTLNEHIESLNDALDEYDSLAGDERAEFAVEALELVQERQRGIAADPLHPRGRQQPLPAQAQPGPDPGHGAGPDCCGIRRLKPQGTPSLADALFDRIYIRRDRQTDDWIGHHVQFDNAQARRGRQAFRLALETAVATIESDPFFGPNAQPPRQQDRVPGQRHGVP